MRCRLRPCCPHGAEKTQDKFCASGSITLIRLLSTFTCKCEHVYSLLSDQSPGSKSQMMTTVGQRDRVAFPRDLELGRGRASRQRG